MATYEKYSITYNRTVRVLHFALAVGIPLQLLLSLIMAPPEPDKIQAAWMLLAFTAHRFLGMALLATLLLHWLLSLSGLASREIGHILPWFSPPRRAAVITELKQILRLRFSAPEAQDNLAGAVQGFGLIIAVLLGLSGAVLFFGIAQNGSMSGAVHGVEELHQMLASVMWIYLAMHAGAAAAHVLAGHRSILSIFRLR